MSFSTSVATGENLPFEVASAFSSFYFTAVSVVCKIYFKGGNEIGMTRNNGRLRVLSSFRDKRALTIHGTQSVNFPLEIISINRGTGALSLQ